MASYLSDWVQKGDGGKKEAHLLIVVWCMSSSPSKVAVITIEKDHCFLLS